MSLDLYVIRMTFVCHLYVLLYVTFVPRGTGGGGRMVTVGIVLPELVIVGVVTVRVVAGSLQTCRTQPSICGANKIL